MARFGVCLGLAVAMVVGCEPPKELPEVTPKVARTSDGPTIPTSSEAAAKACIEKAVTALTGGKPELLAKGKVSRAIFKGRLHRQNAPTSEVLRTVAAVWPDRFADTDQLQSEGNKIAISAYLRRPHLVVVNNGTEFSPPNPVEYERNFAADEVAKFWMPLLLPVTDPKAIVFDLQSITGTTPGTGEPLPIQLVKLSLAEFPVYQLTFDANTHLLLRVDYITSELGVRYREQWTALDHKAGPDGLTVPGKVEYRRNGFPAEQFAVEKWEFPASINDDEFSPPKK